MLLQQRSALKYHSPLLWSNACCAHPCPGELAIDAAHRGLKKEMGFDYNLKVVENSIYEADLGDGFFEYEYNHLIIRNYDGDISIKPDEVKSFKWMLLDDLVQNVENYPEKFTEWFKVILKKIYKLKKNINF